MPPTLDELVEKAVNRYLQADPQAAARLGRMQGKVIGLEVTTLDLVLFFLPRDGVVAVTRESERTADTWVRGGVFDLFKLGFANPRELSAQAEITGDVALGQSFQQVFKDIEFDWEELFAPWLGDAFAHELGRGARGAADWFRRAVDSLAASSGEYLEEELRLVPGADEIRDFIEEVDKLRNAVERLEARPHFTGGRAGRG